MVSVIVSDHCILYIVCPTAELKITLLQHFRLNMDTLSHCEAGTSHLCDGSAHSSGCVVNAMIVYEGLTLHNMYPDEWAEPSV